MPERAAGDEPRRDEPQRRPAGDGLALLVAFLVTTLVMVVGIAALAVLGPWWLIVPVVLVHWYATYVIIARIGLLLDDA